MSECLGDFPVNGTVQVKWSTSLDGESITRATDGTLRVYKNASLTQRASAAGITETEDFDAVTGIHHITVDLSDNTDAGFYAAGNEYQLVMVGMVISAATVNAVIAHFSIERAGGILATVKALNNVSAAQINAEVVDALATDTYAEPGQGTPAATLSLAGKIGYLMKAWRNRTTQTASQYSLFNDNATTIDHKATFVDDTITADRGEVSTGP